MQKFSNRAGKNLGETAGIKTMVFKSDSSISAGIITRI